MSASAQVTASALEMIRYLSCAFFFFSSRRRHTRCLSDWSSDVCSSDLFPHQKVAVLPFYSETVRYVDRLVFLCLAGVIVSWRAPLIVSPFALCIYQIQIFLFWNWANGWAYDPI